MRIGEIAALVGVTPRTVRHYHHLGLLPEPERLSNGYRDYGLRHAAVLARVRRLAELGLGLAEIRDVLADDAGRELVDVLEELDRDLEHQQSALAARRGRLAELMGQARRGQLPPEGPLSPELASVLGAIEPTGSAMAAMDRDHLALMDTVMSPEDRGRLFTALRPMTEDAVLMERVSGLYDRLDALAEAGADDPRVGPLAEELADCMPGELVALMGEEPVEIDGIFGGAFLADFAPAQAAVVRRMIAVLVARRSG
jgi:DNA-binding transcriptional MerR regulator